jgi:hypothetical protein
MMDGFEGVPSLFHDDAHQVNHGIASGNSAGEIG